MQKTILTFRHGTPEEQLQKCCRGKGSDCLLSPEGEAQTRANVEYIIDRCKGNLEWVLVVTSGMKRTDRFGHLLAANGATHVPDPVFKPIDAGDWEGMPWSRIQTEWQEQFRNCTENGDALDIPGAVENVAAFKERVISGWQQWSRAIYKHLIIVAHDSVNGVIHQHVTKEPLLNLRGQTIGGMHEYAYDSDGNIQLLHENVVPYQQPVSL